MSYTPTTWQDGDVIVAEKLNHAEAGIGDGGLPKNVHTEIELFDGNVITEYDQNDGWYVGTLTGITESFVDGEKYTVVYDGATYECFADANDYGVGFIIVGDFDENGFCFGLDTSDNITYLYVRQAGRNRSGEESSESVTHSVVITRSQNTVPESSVMVYDGTNWKVQNGYGYEVPRQNIIWDFSTQGRDSFTFNSTFTFYKISDDIIKDATELNGASILIDGIPIEYDCEDTDDNCLICSLHGEEGDPYTDYPIIFTRDTNFIAFGIAFTAPVGVYSLVIHNSTNLEIVFKQIFSTIDPKLLPVKSPVVNNSMTFNEVVEAYKVNGKIYYMDNEGYMNEGFPRFTGSELTGFNFYRVTTNIPVSSNGYIKYNLIAQITENGWLGTVIGYGYHVITLTYSSNNNSL